MKVTCHVRRAALPADLYERLVLARESCRGGDAAMLRRFAQLGMEQASVQARELKLRTVEVLPPAGEGWVIVLRFADGSELADRLREWGKTFLLSTGAVFMLLAAWGWEQRRSDSTRSIADPSWVDRPDGPGSFETTGAAKHQAPAAKQIPPVAQQKPASAQRSEDTRETTRPTGSMEGLTPAQVVEQMTPAQLAIANDLLSQFDFAVTPVDLGPAP